MSDTINILFVCMGNICRSPTAEGIFTTLVEEQGLSEYFMIDSAGTHHYHIGYSPDERAQHVTKKNGIDISHLKARMIERADFCEFNHILAMDNTNYENLCEISPKKYQEKIELMLDYLPAKTKSKKIIEVPDPYYGSEQGFVKMFKLLQASNEELIKYLIEKYDL